MKGHQNWVKMSGEYLTFPGGGTQFKNGALHYIDFLQEVHFDISFNVYTIFSLTINIDMCIDCSHILILLGETELVLYWMLGVVLLASEDTFLTEMSLLCHLHQKMNTRRRFSLLWNVVSLLCQMLWEPRDCLSQDLFSILSIVLVVESLGILKVVNYFWN